MTEYLIYFNQQWVGDHTEEWFRARGPLAMAVVDEMKAAGVYVFAGGLEEEDGPVYSADPTSGAVMITDGPYVESKEFLGGFAWWTWPTTRPPRCGPARSPKPAAGPMRFDDSSRNQNPAVRSRLVDRELAQAMPRGAPANPKGPGPSLSGRTPSYVRVTLSAMRRRREV
jgi:hypothetical protein